MRTSAYAVAGLAALALGVAGCGSDNNKDSSASTPASTPAPAATTPSTSTPAASGAASTVPVSATEFKFTPGTLKAKAGAVTFDLKNAGGAQHALEIEGNGVEKASSTINAGQSTQVKVNLKPGKYEFYCPVDGHRQMGMEGTLTVT
jgi:uncharacterized cupredoxin-like copper-binding protein